MKVSLRAVTNVAPREIASFGAMACYAPEEPELGKTIAVEKVLFPTGHHTTFQHFYASFFVEASVADFTLGLHLCSPFYNTGQRSGRFVSGMFNEKGVEAICAYVNEYWSVSQKKQREIEQYVRVCIDLYCEHLPAAEAVARSLLIAERPKAGDAYLEQNAPKIAQEQLRNFIPISFPTAGVYTVNTSALAALHRVAWTEQMKSGIAQMIDLVEGDVDFLKAKNDQVTEFDFLDVTDLSYIKLETTPSVYGVHLDDLAQFEVPTGEEMGKPVDLLHFSPRLMANNLIDIETRVTSSLATLGQMQRHRTIRRSLPEWAGAIYSPPILNEVGIGEKLRSVAETWVEISQDLPTSLGRSLAPYGAMVCWTQKASMNAFIHEQAKRTCWCAQQEVNEISRQTRYSLSKQYSHIGQLDELLAILNPHCITGGKCVEGKRYCGRDMSITPHEVKRKV